MHKFKQAIPFADQTPGFETDVVSRALLVARDMGWNPVTAWLQWESNAERTVVAVVVDAKFRALVAEIELIEGNERVSLLGEHARKQYRMRTYRSKNGYVIQVHKDLNTKRVTVLFHNRM